MDKKHLLLTAKVSEEAAFSGYGSHWSLFAKDRSIINLETLLPEFVGSESMLAEIISDEDQQWLDDHNEPKAAGLFYRDNTELQMVGCISVIEIKEDENLFVAAFPIFWEGVTITATIDKVSLREERLEACLTFGVGCIRLTAFDTNFWASRMKYVVGKSYNFCLSSIAHSFEVVDPDAPEEMHVITNPEVIKAIQLEDRDECEAQDQITISMAQMHTLMNDTNVMDMASYRGRVVDIKETKYLFLNTEFRRVDVLVYPREEHNEKHEGIILPVFVSEHIIERELPQVGEFVKGIAWLQINLERVNN